MNRLSDEQLNKISNLVREIEKLSDIEKLLLYLKLPCGRIDQQDVKGRNSGKTGADIFAKKPDQETTQTYTWILSHLEEDLTVSLPKQEVYDEYKAFCQINRLEPLCVADFGKAMKHVFPCIKPRRLGQRGNSRYCYSGLRKKLKIQPPTLPDLCIRGLVNSSSGGSSNSNASATNINSATINSNSNYGCCQQTVDSCGSQQSYLDQIGSGGSNANEQYQQQTIEQQQQNSQLCQQQQQQSIGPAGAAPQQQHLFTAYEVMNLKIEPNDGQSAANQPQHPYRSQPPPQPDEACINTHNCQCNHTLTNKIILNGPLPMSISNSANSDNSFMSTAMHHQESSGGDNFTMGPNPSDSGNQQPHRVLNSATNQHPCNVSPCDSVVQLRSGTPDDDDYVHNYQNLTSVDNDRHLISVSMHPLAQIHSQQQQQPSDNSTTQQQTATNQVMTNFCGSTGAPAADMYNQQHPQQPQGTSPSAPIAPDIANNPPTAPSSTHQPQTMINAAAKTMTTIAASAAATNPIDAQNSNNNNNNTDQQPGRHHQQQLRHPSNHRLVHSTVPQHLQHHPYLSTGPFTHYQGFPASLQLHLTELGNPNLDYSTASPFQSPSTTPNLTTMSTGSSSSSSTSGGGAGSGHSPQNIHLGGYYSTSSCLRYIN